MYIPYHIISSQAVLPHAEPRPKCWIGVDRSALSRATRADFLNRERRLRVQMGEQSRSKQGRVL